jgi:hypothetical protein
MVKIDLAGGWRPDRYRKFDNADVGKMAATGYDWLIKDTASAIR